MHKSEPFLENETKRILLEISDRNGWLNPIRRSSFHKEKRMVIKWIFPYRRDLWVKVKEVEKLDLLFELKKLTNMKETVIVVVSENLATVSENVDELKICEITETFQATGCHDRVGKQNHADHSSIEIILNTSKSLGDLWRLVVFQISV